MNAAGTLVALVLAWAVQSQATPPAPSSTLGDFESEVDHVVAGQGNGIVYVAAGRQIAAWDLVQRELAWETEAASPVLADLVLGKEHLFRIERGPGFEPIDTETGQGGRRMTGPLNGPITCGIVDPRERWVWLGSAGGPLLRLTVTDSRAWSRRNPDNGGTLCLAADSAAKTLAIGGKDGTVRFASFSGASIDDKSFLEVGSPVTALAFLAKGTQFVLGTGSGTVESRKTTSKRPVLAITAHTSAVVEIAVDPRSRWIASGDANGEIRLWTLKKGELVLELPGPGTGPVRTLVFVDETVLAAARGERHVTLWDLSSL